jgi:hypothetical protein
MDSLTSRLVLESQYHLAVAAVVASIVLASGACSSIGPTTVPRDRSDYGVAIGDSWKQQTLLNIVKLRYGDFPVFMEVAQVIAGYQLQTTAGVGLSAQNYITTAVGGPAAIAGNVAAGATYIDRPTLIYAPLTGNDFIKTLMRPIPPAAVMFLLQSGYAATMVMPLTVDSINGVTNESRRPGMSRPGDPEFTRLVQLLYELQRADALQIRIERSKDSSDTTVIGFPPANATSDIASKIAEMAPCRAWSELSGSLWRLVWQGGRNRDSDSVDVAGHARTRDLCPSA